MKRILIMLAIIAYITMLVMYAEVHSEAFYRRFDRLESFLDKATNYGDVSKREEL